MPPSLGAPLPRPARCPQHEAGGCRSRTLFRRACTPHPPHRVVSMAGSGLLKLSESRACRGAAQQRQRRPANKNPQPGDPKASFKFLWFHVYSTRSSNIFSLKNGGPMVKFHRRALETPRAQLPSSAHGGNTLALLADSPAAHTAGRPASRWGSFSQSCRPARAPGAGGVRGEAAAVTLVWDG